MQKFFILFVITLVTVALLYPREQELILDSYKIPELKGVTDFIWEDNQTLYIATNTSIYSYDLDSRVLDKTTDLNSEAIMGRGSGGEIIYCTWVNREILSLEEDATTISVHALNGELIKELAVHETLRPTTCSSKNIEAIDNYHGSPGRTYSIDLDKGIVKETQPDTKEEANISGDLNTYIKIDEVTYTLELPNDFTRLKTTEDHKRVALLTYEGEIVLATVRK